MASILTSSQLNIGMEALALLVSFLEKDDLRGNSEEVNLKELEA